MTTSSRSSLIYRHIMASLMLCAYSRYLTEQLESLNQEREDKKKDIKTKSANMERKWKASNNHEEEADKIFAQLSQIRKAEKAQLEDIKKQERELERMIKEFEKPLETEDEDAINAKLVGFAATMLDMRGKLTYVQHVSAISSPKSSRRGHAPISWRIGRPLTHAPILTPRGRFKGPNKCKNLNQLAQLHMLKTMF